MIKNRHYEQKRPRSYVIGYIRGFSVITPDSAKESARQEWISFLLNDLIFLFFSLFVSCAGVRIIVLIFRTANVFVVLLKNYWCIEERLYELNLPRIITQKFPSFLLQIGSKW